MEKNLSDEDKKSIFDDVGRMRNRDEIATSGNRMVQGGSAEDIDDTWEFERKHTLRRDKSQSSDAVDDQFKTIADLHQDVSNSDSHRTPTLAKPVGDDDVLAQMSDDELNSIADTLGIPERDKLPHMALVQKIREYEMRAL